MSQKPHSSNPSPQAAEFSEGKIIQYDDEGSVILGVVLGARKDKVVVLNSRGRELDLARGRLYPLPGFLDGGLTSTTARTSRLQEIDKELNEAAAKLDIIELWSFVNEESRRFSVSELSTLYLGADDLVSHGATRVALIRERIHFKRDRDSFEPRPQNIVAELIRAEDVKAQRRAARERCIEFVKARILNPTLEAAAEVRDSLRLIEEVAASIVDTDPARQKEAREFTHLCAESLCLSEGMPIEKRAFETLRRLGIFNENTNLSLIRYRIPLEQTVETEAEASQINIPAALNDFSDEERSFRRDLTRLFTFTIDDISTKDMDDAISLDRTPEGYNLSIHITDVSTVVMPGSRIDRAAKHRATSLYCADRTINMIPDRLAEEVCSLRVGVVRPALTVIIKLSESYEILSSEVCGSFIKTSRRYTYDEVDDLLESGDSTLLLLHEIASASEERRIRNGAMRVQKREVVPFFESGRVRLQEIDESSPARLLVSEMMVLANIAMAEFAAKNGIPVLFRGQERPDDNLRENDDNEKSDAAPPHGPAKDFSARVKLKKSYVALDPLRHAGLGVHAYIQATSPIRRYMDLCHQRQFISFLAKGRPWLVRDEFAKLADEVEEPLQRAGVASRETKRYWLLRYLEQRERNQPLGGTVVRVDVRTPIVELDEVYLTAAVKFKERVALGQRVALTVSAVDPHGDFLKLG